MDLYFFASHENLWTLVKTEIAKKTGWESTQQLKYIYIATLPVSTQAPE